MQSQRLIRIVSGGITAVAVLLIGALYAPYALAQEGDPGQVTGAAGSREACGLVVYDWNGPVEKADRGFPSEKPPRENFDWTGPVNYAAGELFFRAEIFKQPEAQDMRLQLCFWQPETPDGHPYRRESCGPMQAVQGTSGEVVTWSRPVEEMWKKNGIGVDWAEPRSRASVAIKNSSRQPVSNHSGWEWNGEDPDAWYPLNMRFTAVVVPAGGEFCGWDYYFTPSAVQLSAMSAHAPAQASAAAQLWFVPALAVLFLFVLSGAALLPAIRRP